MYSLDELAAMFFLKPSTVRQYIYLGLLPAARSTGPGKHYGQEHVTALKAYRKDVPRAGDRVTIACLIERRQLAATP